MDDIKERWDERQNVLIALLRAHGAERHDWRVDLGLGRFWWQDPATGAPSVVADTKVLGSWALSNGSLLAAWENGSLPPSATVAPVAGVPARHTSSDESEVWTWALQIAEGAGAHFVYRAPNAQNWIFLGLWNVRTAGEGEATFAPGPPWDHVEMVLAEIARLPDAEACTLARNYGRTFVEDPVRRGTRWEASMRAIGERLIACADADPATRSATLEAMLADVRTRTD